MATDMHFGATKKTFKFASELRKKLTPAEELLWMNVCKGTLGYKFRRQHRIWRFVADFYCHDHLLIIEIDGRIHDLEEIKRNDQDREKFLKGLGLKVIRFSNDQVLNDIAWILNEIRTVIVAIDKDKFSKMTSPI